MGTGRLEAFSDGVLAIIITIMVLELKVPHAAGKVNGSILWAKMHLLFWLSLVPFVTGWMGENHFAALPVALYGAVLLMAGIAYFILARVLAAHHGRDSKLAVALGRDTKRKASVVTYAAVIPLSFVNPGIAFALYVLVAVIWFIPDRRIERALAE